MKMYSVTKTIEIDAAHNLSLDYESKCANIHGHRWKISVTCESYKLNKNGMVIDFTDISKPIKELDHTLLNNHSAFRDKNSSAENIAEWLVDTIPNAVKATVEESPGNIAMFEVLGDEREKKRNG